MKHLRLLALLFAIVVAIGLVGCVSDDSGDSGDSSDPEVTTSENEDGSVRVTLSWSEDADLDLEIWDAAGEELLVQAWELSGIDDMGPGGEEYFDFKDHGGEDDYSTGAYVVSVFFADYDSDEEAGPVVSWTDEDGDPQDRTTAMDYFDNDQWHVVQIDAETGNTTDIDEFIEYEMR